ncbi:MAG: phosphoribosylamine--glycine ligase [Firmicutes bacterium]|nr:phosphoribosylamine--glycine ligase [Bacillota bacterium]
MRVLVVGGGGREHALVWKLAQTGTVGGLFCAPGNAGTAALGTNVDIAATDVGGLRDFAVREGIGLTVVGPEDPLVAGIGDAFAAAGLRLFGPSRQAARLEGSKAFAKEFMARHGIPTAPFEVFDDAARARDYIRARPGPVVVKADGLAAGKGAFVCSTTEEALQAVTDLMERGMLGVAGRTVVVEDRLEGEELSVLALCDGESFMLLPPARDHKRAFDGDAGPNTGGMGAFAPVPLPPGLLEEVRDRVIAPAVRGMAREGCPYRGILYAGLMLTRDGPAVLEFNCRFGDPETQVILPLLDEDLAELLAAAASDRLPARPLRLHNRYAVCVVVASGGYPGPYRRGLPIAGLERAAEVPGVVIFEAGTACDAGGRLVTSGGRVLGVTGCGRSLAEARERAYRACARISFEGMHYRRDIAAPAGGAPGGNA